MIAGIGSAGTSASGAGDKARSMTYSSGPRVSFSTSSNAVLPAARTTSPVVTPSRAGSSRSNLTWVRESYTDTSG